jgi:hypothetical protein
VSSTEPGWLTPGRFYLGLAILTLIIGALSLLIPSTPSYDPWSWILWGRQIVHGHLTITTGGTSWKPLPMIFTIPFALFGKAGPDLWLVVARAGALAAVVMVFRLAYRLTRQVGGLFGGSDGDLGRLTTVAPALLAGLIGAVGLALSASGGFVSANALGYSEGLATALLLIAIERPAASGLRDGLLRGSGSPGDLAVLGSVWPMAVLEGPGHADCRGGQRLPGPGLLVCPGEAGLRILELQRVPRRAPTVKQPGLRV